MWCGAWETVRASPVDVLIVDLGLSGMCAVDMIRVIRQERPRIRVFAATTARHHRWDDAARATGVGVLVPHPSEINDLFAMLQAMADRAA